MAHVDLPSLIRREAVALAGLDDVGAIVAALRDARVVLLGEATHGSHEFYRLRDAISRRLIGEHGFDAVAVEADWPDASRVNRWVQGDATIASADDALGAFERFPRWMWRNREARDFVAWLHGHNAARPPGERTGFHGLDLYSLHASIEAVVRYLDPRDPALARQARRRYDCFAGLAQDPQRYGFESRRGTLDDCEREVVQQLQELLSQRLPHPDGDELFEAQQNARVVADAERYYRVMYRGGADAWNLRDTHMADTLDALRTHLAARRGRPARVIVWAHNSHVGDARATEMGERQGQCTLGQLARERASAPGEVAVLGFTTHAGHVAAAPDWDEPVQHMAVRPSREDSVERALHDAGLPLAFVPLRGALHEPLGRPRLERAIGVIYRPDTERWSHYFQARVARQFDALVHVDRTRAVDPLDAPDAWHAAYEEETYPSGL